MREDDEFSCSFYLKLVEGIRLVNAEVLEWKHKESIRKWTWKERVSQCKYDYAFLKH